MTFLQRKTNLTILSGLAEPRKCPDSSAWLGAPSGPEFCSSVCVHLQHVHSVCPGPLPLMLRHSLPVSAVVASTAVPRSFSVLFFSLRERLLLSSLTKFSLNVTSRKPLSTPRLDQWTPLASPRSACFYPIRHLSRRTSLSAAPCHSRGQKLHEVYLTWRH